MDCGREARYTDRRGERRPEAGATGVPIGVGRPLRGRDRGCDDAPSSAEDELPGRWTFWGAYRIVVVDSVLLCMGLRRAVDGPGGDLGVFCCGLGWAGAAGPAAENSALDMNRLAVGVVK